MGASMAWNTLSLNWAETVVVMVLVAWPGSMGSTKPPVVEGAGAAGALGLGAGVKAATVPTHLDSSIWGSSGLVTNSIIFCRLFTIKDRCKKVRFLQTQNQGLRQLLLTVSWDLCA